MVLLWDMRHSQDAAVTAAKILQALREPHHINKHKLRITASIGIATYPDDGTDADTLMKKADLAMYHAKEAGRDSYQFFESEMNAHAIERQSLEEDLHYAIERQELVLHYQPKVNLTTGAIIGAEALIRWRHPQRGLVLPGQFISIAEERRGAEPRTARHPERPRALPHAAGALARPPHHRRAARETSSTCS